MSQEAGEVLGSPLRTLAATLIFVGIVFFAATIGYTVAGWSLGDSAYMVLLTIFSVGYGEVHPIDTAYLRELTSATMILGCTGMIVLTGALVQVFTLIQIRSLLGVDRMNSQIDQLSDHVIICGWGRIGVQIARELARAASAFVVIERDAAKAAAAQAEGFLVITAEATDEGALEQAGIAKARVLATVLPNDAANVFITLSARSLNPAIEIIARGEAPSTESKLFHAGASKVVLPTHIGAERIVEMILYPATQHTIGESVEMTEMKRGLHDFGLDLEVVMAAENGALTGETVFDAERRGGGAFFIVQIERIDGQTISHPGPDVPIEAGDTVLLVVRGNRLSAGALFSRPAVLKRRGRGYLEQ
jgi:Trk K+ transport system NAD-binding subunit